MQRVLTHEFRVDRFAQLERMKKKTYQEIISDSTIGFDKILDLIKVGRLDCDIGAAGNAKAAEALTAYMKDGHSLMEAYIDVMNELQHDLPFMLGFSYDTIKQQILDEGERLKKQSEDIKNYTISAE